MIEPLSKEELVRLDELVGRHNISAIGNPTELLWAFLATIDRLQKALDSLEVVTRAYLQYPLEGEEPGYSAEDVLTYCDEARTVIDATPKDPQ